MKQELLDKLKDAYNTYTEEEFGDEPVSSINENEMLGILYTTAEVDNEEGEEPELEVKYDIKNQEIVIFLDGEEKIRYEENISFMTEEFESCTFQNFYDDSIDRLRDKGYLD